MKNNIAHLRKMNSMTQTELGKQIGVSQITISHWENGDREPDNMSLLCMADFFGVSVEYLLGKSSSPSPSGSRWIPVYGRVAAGIPIEAIEDIIDEEEISAEMAKNGEYIALQIHGDSMEPRMHEGDVVIVRRQDDVESGETAVVLVNGSEATCKRIKKTPDGIMLISTNPAYEPMYYTNAQIETLPVRILGRVVELRAKF